MTDIVEDEEDDAEGCLMPSIDNPQRPELPTKLDAKTETRHFVSLGLVTRKPKSLHYPSFEDLRYSVFIQSTLQPYRYFNYHDRSSDVGRIPWV